MNEIYKYIQKLPEERKKAIEKLRTEILQHLPEGFSEIMQYGMISYVVAHDVYPYGYHCDPKQPLPFMSIASQKNYISVYHMGIYSDPKLMQWFLDEFAKASHKKPDMGKSCIRFKKPEDIPYALFGKLAKKMSATDWVTFYEKLWKK